MRGEEVVLLLRRQPGHAVDVVMAVALDVPKADQIDQSEILLHGQAGLGRQILAGHEISRATAFQHSIARNAPR